jgi:hypothetical protein
VVTGWIIAGWVWSSITGPVAVSMISFPWSSWSSDPQWVPAGLVI